MSLHFQQPTSPDIFIEKDQHQVIYMSHELSPPPPKIPPARDYFYISIFNMIFCCCVAGVGSLIYSTRVRDCNKVGNVRDAYYFSRKSKKYNIIGILLGTIETVGFILLVIYVYIPVNDPKNLQTEPPRHYRPFY